jgi:hypothetical protein
LYVITLKNQRRDQQLPVKGVPVILPLQYSWVNQSPWDSMGGTYPFHSSTSHNQTILVHPKVFGISQPKKPHTMAGGLARN